MVRNVLEDQRILKGYLLLADISGYTAFLTGTELEHANAIVQELSALIRERLCPPMRFVKREGDAVFCFANEAVFTDGERLIELIERCYYDFSNRLLDMTRETTCRCAACASIGTLDLKFILHFGSYVMESDAGRVDLAGADVILAHRLLKNSVSETGGPWAYALVTEPCLRRMPKGLDLPAHSETYESFGQTSGGVLDLTPVVTGMREADRTYVDAQDADVEVDFGRHPYPPAIVWQYFVDPEKRLRWQPLQTDITNRPNRQGRLGAGASSHCAHGVGGDALREYLDWRPFTYFTCRFTPLGRGPHFFRGIETFEFVPVAGGTEVRYRFRLTERGPMTSLRFRALRPAMRRTLSRSQRTLKRTLDEDAERQA